MSEKKQAGKTGFTLVELLVVIGIIAVLISILLPMLGKANRIARLTKCQAQLKQIGVSFFLYAQENNQAIMPWKSTDAVITELNRYNAANPGATQLTYNNAGWIMWPNTAKVIRRIGYGNWTTSLNSKCGVMNAMFSRKLLEPRVLYCPLDRTRTWQSNPNSANYSYYGTYKTDIGGTVWTITSYDINPLQATRLGVPKVNHWFGNTNHYFYTDQLQRLPITRFPLALDMVQRDINTQANDGMSHQPDWNVLCMDGHVERARGDKVMLRQKQGFDGVNSTSTPVAANDYWSEYHYELMLLLNQESRAFGVLPTN